MTCISFQSTLSLRRATAAALGDISSTIFQSTLSLRRATILGRSMDAQKQFQSTLSLRRATSMAGEEDSIRRISIHALLAESDDPGRVHAGPIQGHFNPRSPCGERPRSSLYLGSILDFNPRSPCGERRRWVSPQSCRQRISIHALLAESDDSTTTLSKSGLYFNPRSPCGERPFSWVISGPSTQFQSTLSLRRATDDGREAGTAKQFQSTLSLRRATPERGWPLVPYTDFNPRSPCGERPVPTVMLLE